MTTSPGQFVWFELMTSDLKAAEAFYGPVLGWTLSDSGMPGMQYTIAATPEAPMGGLMTLPAEACAAGARPAWLGYVAVADVDASAARVQAAGGSLLAGPQDIPGVGRFATVTDPQGAAIVLFKGLPGDQPPAPPAGTPGHVGWAELMAGDGASAFEFYAGLFGWRKTEAIDMGPMGTYQLWAGGDSSVGGLMTKPPEMPKPAWRYYFNTAALDAALGRVQAGGGQVLSGPMEVPGGSWVANCVDPQGAAFALVAPVR